MWQRMLQGHISPAICHESSILNKWVNFGHVLICELYIVASKLLNISGYVE